MSKKNWEVYNKFWRQRQDIPSNIRVISAIRKTMSNLKEKKILEVGSAMGRDSIYLAKKGANVFLLDYIEPPLNLANQLAAENNVPINTVVGDALDIPFCDEYFDYVFSQGLLEHFRDPGQLIKEQLRVLKKGGKLLIDVPQKYHLYTIIKKILMAFGKWNPGWETQFSPRQLTGLVKQFEVNKVYLYGDWSVPPLLIKIVMMLLGLPIKYPGEDYRDSTLRSILKKLPGISYTFQHIGVVCEKK